MNEIFRETVACRLCTKPTPMLSTKLCDWCYEPETRVKRDPELALKVLATLPATTIAPLLLPAMLEGLACEEASIHSRETFIPCGAPAAAVVWHRRDGKHTYLMCAACAWHNVRNRGGRLLMATDPRAIL